MLFTGMLGAYLQVSDSFGTVYGPLTGIIALLLWAQLTSVAIFLGMAFAAQLEARRAGTTQGAAPDPKPEPQPSSGPAASALARPQLRLTRLRDGRE